MVKPSLTATMAAQVTLVQQVAAEHQAVGMDLVHVVPTAE